MSDQDQRLSTIVQWLEQDKISTDDAAKLVSKMRFPVSDGNSVWDTLMADAAGDLEPPDPDSFFAVSAAFADGRITDEQYQALAEAAASASQQ